MKIIRTIFALLALAALAVHAQETGADGTVGTGTGGRAAGNGADGTDDPSLPPVPSPPLTGCGMAAIKRCRAAQEPCAEGTKPEKEEGKCCYSCHPTSTNGDDNDGEDDLSKTNFCTVKSRLACAESWAAGLPVCTTGQAKWNKALCCNVCVSQTKPAESDKDENGKCTAAAVKKCIAAQHACKSLERPIFNALVSCCGSCSVGSAKLPFVDFMNCRRGSLMCLDTDVAVVVAGKKCPSCVVRQERDQCGAEKKTCGRGFSCSGVEDINEDAELDETDEVVGVDPDQDGKAKTQEQLLAFVEAKTAKIQRKIADAKEVYQKLRENIDALKNGEANDLLGNVSIPDKPGSGGTKPVEGYCKCGEACKDAKDVTGICQTDNKTCAQNIITPQCDDTSTGGDDEKVLTTVHQCKNFHFSAGQTCEGQCDNVNGTYEGGTNPTCTTNSGVDFGDEEAPGSTDPVKDGEGTATGTNVGNTGSDGGGTGTTGGITGTGTIGGGGTSTSGTGGGLTGGGDNPCKCGEVCTSKSSAGFVTGYCQTDNETCAQNIQPPNCGEGGDKLSGNRRLLESPVRVEEGEDAAKGIPRGALVNRLTAAARAMLTTKFKLAKLQERMATVQDKKLALYEAYKARLMALKLKLADEAATVKPAEVKQALRRVKRVFKSTCSRIKVYRRKIEFDNATLAYIKQLQCAGPDINDAIKFGVDKFCSVSDNAKLCHTYGVMLKNVVATCTAKSPAGTPEVVDGKMTLDIQVPDNSNLLDELNPIIASLRDENGELVVESVSKQKRRLLSRSLLQTTDESMGLVDDIIISANGLNAVVEQVDFVAGADGLPTDNYNEPSVNDDYTTPGGGSAASTLAPSLIAAVLACVALFF